MRDPVVQRVDRLKVQQELQRSLAKPINRAELAAEIATLVTSLGRKVDIGLLTQRLAADLASRFTHKSNELETIIKYRPEELSALAHAVGWNQIQTEVLPMIERQKKSRAKIKTEEERVRRIKAAKNLYERLERNRVTTPGHIEHEFCGSRPRTGPCLDKIFQGGRAQMCGPGDSLQNLFGLSRKRLSMAAPPIHRGREILYDYRGVLACMAALLKQTGSNANWLPDPDRRRIVLTGVLFRAKQEASDKILRAFEKRLSPHLG
jgi:hypothetical protein